MPSADSLKYCPLLKREIRRAYCLEIGDVRNDDMDIEHIEDRFDIDVANEICEKCGWDRTPIK
ncbi:hypothetical protein [Clostridium sp. 'White wine YQ']|uniref:hypothetical protein n=1 Tax=Clostridium sp. 'White wine YQ' TaxID=3027474 RepID=UPI0023655AD3|nr:hypothetical protein [Clostridium sp. 'White wine YQ']MDD7793686.1 hypothetical protein [Clostridium sp. 'White wine YQ']